MPEVGGLELEEELNLIGQSGLKKFLAETFCVFPEKPAAYFSRCNSKDAVM
jgi:hypothetical protein